MLRTGANPFFGNLLTHLLMKISLPSQHSAALTHVYSALKATKIHLQSATLLYTTHLKPHVHVNNMDGAQTKCTPSVYYMSIVPFIRIFSISALLTCVFTLKVYSGQRQSECVLDKGAFTVYDAAHCAPKPSPMRPELKIIFWVLHWNVVSTKGEPCDNMMLIIISAQTFLYSIGKIVSFQQ